MRKLLTLISLAFLVTACDAAGGGNSGPAVLGLANNDQHATVSAQSVQYKPLTGKVVRTQSGITLMHIFVTPAYADTTTLHGSPVAGAVVCMDPPVEGGPQPTQLCNNTAADGTVQFFYASGTKADTFVYYANATVDGEPIHPDSARFVQVPGPLAATSFDLSPWQSGSSAEGINLIQGSTGHPLLRDAYGNGIPFRLRASGWLRDTVVTVGVRQDSVPALVIAQGASPQVGDTATVVFMRADAAATELVRATATLTWQHDALNWIIDLTRQ